MGKKKRVDLTISNNVLHLVFKLIKQVLFQIEARR